MIVELTEQDNVEVVRTCYENCRGRGGVCCNGNEREGKRRRGKPKKRRIDGVESDMRIVSMNVRVVED